MRRLLVIVLLLSGLYTAAAQDVRLKLNTQEGIYSLGDTVRVYGRCLEAADSLDMEIRVNGMDTGHSKVLLGEEFSEIYSEVCDSSKWVAIIINIPGKPAIDIGFMVEPETIRPGYKAPRDLQRFWRREIARMRRSPMQVKVDAVPAPEKYGDSLKCWHIELSMHEGFPVNAYVAVPGGAAAGSLPIRIRAHGATGIPDVRTQSLLEKACKYASKGMIGVDVNAHGMRDGADEQYYKDLDEGLLHEYQHRPLKDRESWYFRLMYLRLVRLVDYLVTLPEWDGTNIMVNGHSQGGGQALALGGIDSRITHVYADEPALCDHGAILLGRYGGWPFARRRQTVPASRLAAKILPYYDGAVLISNYKGKLYIRAGLVDYTCPPTTVWAVYNNATGASVKELRSFRSRHHTNVVWYDKEELSALDGDFPPLDWND